MHSIGRRVGRGEHEDHRRVFRLSDLSADLVTVQSRKVAIEDDHVVAVHVLLGDGVQAVIRDVDGHAFVAKPLGDVVRKAHHVFDDEHSHTEPPISIGCPARGSANVTRRPPSARARRSSVPPWAFAIAATIERPRPNPSSEAVRSTPSLRNGSAS